MIGQSKRFRAGNSALVFGCAFLFYSLLTLGAHNRDRRKRWPHMHEFESLKEGAVGSDFSVKKWGGRNEYPP